MQADLGVLVSFHFLKFCSLSDLIAYIFIVPRNKLTESIKLGWLEGEAVVPNVE